MSARNVKRAEAGLFDEHWEAEDLLVERLRSLEVITVKACFLQIGQPWHHPPFDAIHHAEIALSSTLEASTRRSIVERLPGVLRSIIASGRKIIFVLTTDSMGFTRTLLLSKMLETGMDGPSKSAEARAATASCFAGTVWREQQIPGAPRKL